MSHISLKSAQNGLLNEMGGQFKDKMSNFGKLNFFPPIKLYPNPIFMYNGGEQGSQSVIAIFTIFHISAVLYSLYISNGFGLSN